MFRPGLKSVTLIAAWAIAFALAHAQAAIARDIPKASNLELHEAFARHFIWRNIGPALIGGALYDIAGAHVSLPNGASVLRLYVGGPGGLFASNDEGSHWDSLLLDYPGSAAVNSVAISPQNPDEVWVGTGDPQTAFRPVPGDGVYRSLDGGKHWHAVGFGDQPYIGFVRFDPSHFGTVYVGVIGDLTRPSSQKGLYRSNDDGLTWQHVLSVNSWTGAVDISFHPSDPQTLYVVMQQHASDRLVDLDYGSGSGIFKSTDGGTTWARLSVGVTKTYLLARCAVAVAPSMPNRIYAIVDMVPLHHAPASFTGAKGELVRLYRSDDRGDHWQPLAIVGRDDSFGYWGRLFVDPHDAQRVYYGRGDLYYSSDGGLTTHVVTPRLDALEYENSGPDPHSMWIDPSNSAHLVVGNDHGVFISYTTGKTWRHVDNLTLARVYGIGLGWTIPFTPVVTAMQDSYDYVGHVQSTDRAGVTNADWQPLRAGAETGNGGIDPSDPNMAYGIGAKGQTVQRSDLSSSETNDLGPAADFGQPDQLGDPRRGTITIDPGAKPIFYIGTTHVYRSLDHGLHWRVISPDFAKPVSRPDRIMGMATTDGGLMWWGPFGAYDTVITTIAPSPLSSDVVYVGLRRGVIALTRDGGAHWHNLVLPKALRTAEVTKIVASHFASGRVYASFSRFFEGDLRPYALESTDYGSHWRSIAPAKMERATFWTMAEDAHREGMLVAGTDRGVVGTVDDGASWFRLGTGLPNVRVTDVAIQSQSNDLVIGTWGAGVWVLDNLTPLSQPIQTNCPTMFQATLAFEHYKTDWTLYESPINAAPNPPQGSLLSYYLPRDNSHPAFAELRIRDSSGTVIRRFRQAYIPGLNSVPWDLRLRPLWHDHQEHGFGPNNLGPFVLPGRYRVELAAGQKVNCSAPLRTSVLVTIAGATATTLARFASSYKFRLQAYGLQAQAQQFGIAAAQLGRFGGLLKSPSVGLKSSIRSQIRSLTKRVSELQQYNDVVAAFANEIRENIDGGRGYGGTFGPLSPLEQRLLSQALRSEGKLRQRLYSALHQAHGISAGLSGDSRLRGQRYFRDAQYALFAPQMIDGLPPGEDGWDQPLPGKTRPPK